MNEAAFLDTILENSDDEVVRLAYADWLLERGDAASAARGEFIQVQIQLARRTEGGGNPAEWIDASRVPELKAREQALLAAHGADWAKPLAKIVDSYQFHRGFIENVAIDVNRFPVHAEQIFSAAPVRRLRLNGGINKKAADCPWLARASGLDFSRSQMGDTGLRTLLASPHLHNLTWLDLSHCYLTDRGLEELARAPVLGQLTHLNLAYNLLGLRAVQALFGSPYWGQVRNLVLTGNYYIDSRAQQFLAQSLQGSSNPSLLRSMLQTTSREEREYTNVHVRELARRAGQEPSRAAGILAEGLHDGRRKVRSAAAQMLAQLGPAGASALPRLVQRLFEETELVRDHVAPALARLLPELHPQMQRWLCLLANPLLPATANLRAVLDHPELPDHVREGFAAVCARRAAWWKHIGAGGSGPAPVPETGSYPTDRTSVKSAVDALIARAGQHAARHLQGKRKEEETRTGAVKEAAWLLARLTELFQADLPAVEIQPAVSAGTARRGRRK